MALLTICMCIYTLMTLTARSELVLNAETTTTQILENANADLTGRVAIITGGTSGLGQETARSLALLGCKVILTARDHFKGNKVRSAIIRDLKHHPLLKIPVAELYRNIDVKYLDLSSLQSVLDFAKEFWREHTRDKLDYLFLNAGVMAIPEYAPTVDGYEMQFGVNYLGHYYLTRLLLNKVSQMSLVHKEPGRIISVSSRAHQYAPQPLDAVLKQLESAVTNPNILKVGYEAWANYGISKAFNILFARELQRQHRHQSIVSISLHPGVIRTELQRYISNETLATKTFDKDIEQGSATQLWCALMPVDELKRGGYYVDCEYHNDRLREDLQISDEEYVQKSDEEVKESLAYRLWQISETLIAKKGFTFTFSISDLKKDL